jgi:hypothetical protein
VTGGQEDLLLRRYFLLHDFFIIYFAGYPVLALQLTSTCSLPVLLRHGAEARFVVDDMLSGKFSA